MRTLALVSMLVAGCVCAAESGPTASSAAEAVLRHIASTYPLADSQTRVCITVNGQEISPDFKSSLSGTGLHIVSCSATGLLTRIPIGEPRSQPDGTYLVSYGYYLNCGEGCVQGKSMFASMRRGTGGWQVIRVQGGVNF